MHIQRKAIVLASSLLMGASGAAYAPIGCGCVDVNEVAALQLGVTNPDDLLKPNVVLASVRKLFVGRRLSPEHLGDNFCATTDGVVVCRYWLWKKPGYLKAMDLVIWVDHDGRYVASRVSYSELPTRISGT